MHKEKKPVNLGKTLNTKYPGCDIEKVAVESSVPYQSYQKVVS